jgi:hypothetical protein
VIFLGSCIDLQAVARSENFWTHLYFGLFERLAAQTGVPVLELRRICLEHQKVVLRQMLADPSEDSRLVRELLHRIEKLDMQKVG